MATAGLNGDVTGRRGALGPDRFESAQAFRDDRGRFRRRMRAASLVGALFLLCFVRIWLSTEVSSRGSRLTELRQENKILTTDLIVAQAELDQRRMYGALLVPAERAGFVAAMDRRPLQVETVGAALAPSTWSQLGDEMRRSSRFVLTEAFAQGWRDSRAQDDGARP